MMKSGWGVLAVVLIIQSASMIASAQAAEVRSIEPDPSVQEWIKQVVVLETQEELLEAISTFRQTDGNAETLIRQLVYFQVNAQKIYAEDLSHEEISKRAMVANGVIAFLLDWDTTTKRPTPSSSRMLIEAVRPYLATTNLQMRKELHHTLEWVDQIQGGKKDFAQYESYLADNTNGLAGSLITYMYDQDPRAAVLSLSRVYGLKAEEEGIADQLDGDPKAALQLLADRAEWWVHLYVAEKLRKNPKLQSPTVIERLKKSDHPLVKEAVSKIKKK